MVTAPIQLEEVRCSVRISWANDCWRTNDMAHETQEIVYSHNCKEPARDWNGTPSLTSVRNQDSKLLSVGRRESATV